MNLSDTFITMIENSDKLPWEKIIDKANSIPISKLDLSKRAINRLMIADIKTIGELLTCDINKLMSIPYFVESTKIEIASSLQAFVNLFNGNDEQDLEVQQDIPSDTFITMINNPGDHSWETIVNKASGIPVSKLGLSTKAINRLLVADVKTIGDLLTYDINRLMAIPYFGQSVKMEISSSLQAFVNRFNINIDQDIETDQSISSETFITIINNPGDHPWEMIVNKTNTIPISKLGLSKRAINRLIVADIKTIGELLIYDINKLMAIPYFGESVKTEISSSLQVFINNLDINGEQYTETKDNIPFVSIPQDQNIIEALPNLLKDILNRFDQDREFNIISKRYGLDSNNSYTLQDIGYFYNITRERVRQIENRSIMRLHNLIIKGIQPKQWRLYNNIIEEANTLMKSISNIGEIITEEEVLLHIEDIYGKETVNNRESIIRLLMRIFNFEPLSDSLSGFFGELNSCWTKINLDKSKLIDVLGSTHKILLNAVKPQSMFDLFVKIKPKNNIPSLEEYIRYSAIYCKEIEVLPNNDYQIALQYLPSLADKAYRILYEEKAPLNLNTIVRHINHRLARAGFSPTSQLRSLQGQMVQDPRFAPIGHNSVWGLSEWKNIEKKTIFNLMKDIFHKEQRPLSVQYIYDYIKRIRPEARKSSIQLYLYYKTEVFTRVSLKEYELKEWGSKPYISQSKVNKNTFNAKIKSIFEKAKSDTVYLSFLVKELVSQTGFSPTSIYQRLSFSNFIEIKDDPNKKRRKLVRYLNISSDSSHHQDKSTMRYEVQTEIRKFVAAQLNNEAFLSTIADHILKKTSCKTKSTFYRYLSEMDDIIKKITPDGTLCQLVNANPHNTAIDFPIIKSINDESLRGNLERAQKNMNIENVDLALFQLGKIFELELKNFLSTAKSKGAATISNKDLSSLSNMIDCVEKNNIINKKHHLDLLREHRNERAHGKIPNLVERQTLLQHAPFLGDLYIKYIIFFHSKTEALNDSSATS